MNIVTKFHRNWTKHFPYTEIVTDMQISSQYGQRRAILTLRAFSGIFGGLRVCFQKHVFPFYKRISLAPYVVKCLNFSIRHCRA